MITSYSSIYALGHRAARDIFQSPVVVEEKVDGSQIGFKRVGDEVVIRSKGAEIHVGNVPKLFQPSVNAILAVKDVLVPGWTYRGEAFCKPKHNALAYDRVPTNHIMLFDVDRGFEDYMPYADKKAEAERLGFECIPLLCEWQPGEASPEKCMELLNRYSVLGGQRIEGFVVKCYGMFGPDKKTLMAKYVSEGFKEVHQKNFRKDGDKKDVLETLADAYKTEARWNKAIAHLRESGQLTESPKDIGPLMREVAEDVERECKAEIQERLFDWAWKVLSRRITAGLPDWYKKQLVAEQFSDSSV